MSWSNLTGVWNDAEDQAAARAQVILGALV